MDVQMSFVEGFEMFEKLTNNEKKAIEQNYKENQYKKSMAPLWCVNKQFADMKGDKKFHDCTMMLLANTGFASMNREKVFVTI